jgi:zinc and cadmium transporter
LPALSNSSGLLLALLATLIAVGGAALGVYTAAGASRRIVPFSGGLLMGIGVFAVLPELTSEFGWTAGFGALAVSVGLLWAFDRYVHPICPSCSHTHNHDRCATTLHGFAPPLVAAAALHAFLDGLGIAAGQQETAQGLGATIAAGVLLHKIPEGVALGIMLRAAVGSRWRALAWCVAAEAATFLGAALESVVTGRFGVEWVGYALALAGGSFLYLGFHAVHGEWRRRGVPAFMPAITGAAGAAVIHHGMKIFLR